MVFIINGENTEATKENIPTFLKEKLQEEVRTERRRLKGEKGNMFKETEEGMQRK